MDVFELVTVGEDLTYQFHVVIEVHKSTVARTLLPQVHGWRPTEVLQKRFASLVVLP